MKQVGIGNSQQSLVANSWFDWWTFLQKGLNNENEATMRVPSPFTRTKLCLWTPTPPGGVATRTWTIRRNNIDVLVLTMTGAEQEIRWIGSIPFALGDLESLHYTEAGGPTTTAYYHVGWEIETADQFTSLYHVSRFELQAPQGGLNRFMAPLSGAYGVTSIDGGTDILAMPGEVIGAAITVSPPLLESEWEFTWWLNGVKQDGSPGTVDTRIPITVPAATVGTTFAVLALPLVAGDIVALEAEFVSGWSIGWATYSTIFYGTVPNQSMFPSAHSDLPAEDRFTPIRSTDRNTSNWHTADLPVSQGQTFSMVFGLRDLWSWTAAAPTPGTRTIYIRVNGADTALAITQSGAVQIFSNLVDVVTVPPEATLDAHGTLGGAPSEGFQSLNMIQDTTAPPVVPTFNTATRIIRRMRRTPHLSSENLRQFVSKLELEFQRGVGLTTGQGRDPQIMLRWSKDGGQTWSNEHWTTAGTIGNYTRRAIWRRIGAGRDFVFEVTMTDPVLWCLLDAYLDVDLGDS